MRIAFCVLFVLLNTNQYNTNTMGRKTAKDNELKNIDLSNLVLINNIDGEVMIGYNIEGKQNTVISNSLESEKILVHHHYGTIIQNRLNNPYRETELIFDPHT